VKHWTAAERQQLRDDVPRLGFAAAIAGCSVLQLARTTITLAEAGLSRRRRLHSAGQEECRHLRPIQGHAARGITPAGRFAEKFQGEWNHSVAPAYKEYAY